jgi:hypothetical protein
MQHFLKEFDNLPMQKMVRSSMEWTSSTHAQLVQGEEKMGLDGLLNSKPENLILCPEISQSSPCHFLESIISHICPTCRQRLPSNIQR